MRQILEGFKMKILEPVKILCDNSSAIDISKNPILHTRAKHIELKYHFEIEKV